MKKKYKYAITVGVFDCLHEGHVELIKLMKEKAETSIVIIHDDYSTFLNKKRVPIQSLDHRRQNLSLLQNEIGFFYIDYCFDKDPTKELTRTLRENSKIKDYIYIRGDDWKDFPAKKYLDEQGIEILYKPYTKGVSTTQIRKDILN